MMMILRILDYYIFWHNNNKKKNICVCMCMCMHVYMHVCTHACVIGLENRGGGGREALPVRGDGGTFPPPPHSHHLTFDCAPFIAMRPLGTSR